MNVIVSPEEMKRFSQACRDSGKRIGLVATMGSLHEGHLSLARSSLSECDVTVVSVFVNPCQFCPGEDLEKYPRDMEKDRALLEKEGVDVLFAPDESEMYPGGYSTFVEVKGPVSEALCGASRPGHFSGVSTVVAKLFNITSPHISYFGRKDAQQAAVIIRMVRDLDIDVDIRVMPVVRESDGLAMSSRNNYLSEEERGRASVVYRALEKGRKMAVSGETKAGKILEKVKDVIMTEKGISIDYVEMVDSLEMTPLEKLETRALIAVAVRIGQTRLIDNVIIDAPNQGGKN